MTERRVPERTCVGCFKVRPKREMVRVVRTLEGKVEVDLTGKKSGRGAYLCRDRSCWETALEKNRLEHALQTILGESRALLETYAQSMPLPEAERAS